MKSTWNKKIEGVTSQNFYKAVEMFPKDDSYHGDINFLDIEWWYFDAVFDNGYSIHVGVRTYHIKNFGIVQHRINIYHNGKIIKESKKVDLFSKFCSDNDFPNLYIDEKEVIKFDEKHYNKTSEWKYYLDFNIDNTVVDLEFKGSTKGWKIETPTSCWAVSLPKAYVKGSIKINDKMINVKGIGYHDHNWNYSPITAMNNLGWFWGRITADTLNITWAKTMENFEKYDLLSIINQDRTKSLNNNNEFFNIDPNNIIFKQSNYIKDHRHLIPTEYFLEIQELLINQNFPVDVKIHMKTLDVQHTRIFTIHYWRYHVETNGRIKFGSTTENLDNKPQIIEYLSFKS